MTMNRPLQVKVSIAYDELWVEMTADGVSYAPDAVDDMMRQVTKAFSLAITELRKHGVIQSLEDQDEIEVELEDDEEEEDE